MSSSPRFSLTVIGAGFGLAISAATFTTATFTQRLIPLEWAALLLAGTTGTGAVVGRLSDRRAVPARSGLPPSATELQLPHPEDPETVGLYRETCTTVATHLCQVPAGTQEYQEALIAGSTVTTNLRSALIGEQPKPGWQAVMERWRSAADAVSGAAIDPISGVPLFQSPVPQEESSYEPETHATTDSSRSALPDPPASLFSFLGSGRAPATSTPPVEELAPAGVGASSHDDGGFSLDDGWD